MLPAGSTEDPDSSPPSPTQEPPIVGDLGPAPAIEVYYVPLEVSDAVANLRAQLPINGPYDGLPWCSEDINRKLNTTMWLWTSGKDLVSVHLADYYPQVGVRGSGSEVTIMKGADDEGGCDATPAAATVITSDGTFLVGTDIQPGLWRSDGGTDGMPCYWKRLSGLSGSLDDIIQNNLSDGPQVAQIQSTDKAFVTAHCQDWHKSP